MKNFKLNTGCGDMFDSVAKQAKSIAKSKSVTVEFDFNGVKCLVNKETNLDYLYRDYSNAWTMKWKVVGPECYEFYEPEVQAELERLTKINEEKAEKKQEEYRKKEAAEKALFDAKVTGIELELKDAEGWNKSREANTDSYGKAVLDYAEGWAKLMQVEITKGRNLAEIAKSTSYELGFMGITGFMYGCAVNLLSACWIHGEELRKWHNKEYSYKGKGVVNPAILTIEA
jgi:hypothetical protein